MRLAKGHNGNGVDCAHKGEFQVDKEHWRGAQGKQWSYPTPPSGGVVETIHGVQVHDPWRALETLDSAETKDFIDAQNELSRPYLESHPAREQLQEAVASSLSYIRTSCPRLQVDGWYYWLYNDGSLQRDIMVRSKDLDRDYARPAGSVGDDPQVVFDPNSEENVSLYMYSWSPSGKLLTLILQKSGSDWQTIRTIDTETKERVGVELGWSKFTFGATYIGEKAILYKGRIGRPGQGEPDHDATTKFGLFLHRFGTSQDQDVVVWRATTEYRFFGRPRILTADEQEGSGQRKWVYLDLYKTTSPETEVLLVEIPGDSQTLASLESILPELVMKKRRWLTANFTGTMNYIGTLPNDRMLFYSTTDGMAAGHVVGLDAADYDASSPGDVLPLKQVIPADPEGHVLRSAHLVGGTTLVLLYSRHVCAKVVFADALTGKPIGRADPAGSRGDVVANGPIDLPVPDQQIDHNAKPPVIIPKHASISSVSSRPDADDFYMAVATYISTPYVLAGKVVHGPHGVEINIHGLGDASTKTQDMVCRQVFYDSFDGTKIPMFIAHRADLDTSVPQPTMLHAYGGFCVPMLPHFDPFFLAVMRNLHGILAVAGIRGGGEYGKPWHEAAVGVKRHVAWDDFAWGAKFLHATGITTPLQTIAYGTSNGGLLVSAALIRYPTLFRVVIPHVPVEDLLRFHLFGLGKIWLGEYGSPEDPEQFRALAKLSPLHNVSKDENVTYPAVLLVTADHDTRVLPGHALKFLAELQTRTNPHATLGRIYQNAGHEAASKSKEQTVGETTDRLVFILESIMAPCS